MTAVIYEAGYGRIVAGDYRDDWLHRPLEISNRNEHERLGYWLPNGRPCRFVHDI